MAKKARSFDARAFLESAGLGKRVVTYARGDVIFFMNKFKKLGFVEYNGGLQINPSLRDCRRTSGRRSAHPVATRHARKGEPHLDAGRPLG